METFQVTRLVSSWNKNKLDATLFASFEMLSLKGL